VNLKNIAILLAFFAAVFAAPAAMAQIAPLTAPSAEVLAPKLTAISAEPNFAVIAICNGHSSSCGQFKEDVALSAATIKGGWTGAERMNSAEYFQLDATAINIATLARISASSKDSVQKAAAHALHHALLSTAASAAAPPLLVLVNRKTGEVVVIKNAFSLNAQIQGINEFLKR